MARYLFAVFISIVAILPTQAASFDCNKAIEADELAICSSRALNDLDVEMSVKYHFLRGLFAMGVAGEMADAQSDWLKSRHKCHADAMCLKSTYQGRIRVLDEQYQAINKPL